MWAKSFLAAVLIAVILPLALLLGIQLGLAFVDQAMFP